MTKSLLVAAVVVLGLTWAAVPGAYAQRPITTHVPFAFVVNDKVLPAGDYVLIPDMESRDVLQIISKDGKYDAITLFGKAGESVNSGSTLQFKKFGDVPFLWRVNVPGDEVREVELSGRVVSEGLVASAKAKPAAETPATANGE